VGGNAYCNDLVSVWNFQASYSSMAHLSDARMPCWLGEKEGRSPRALSMRPSCKKYIVATRRMDPLLHLHLPPQAYPTIVLEGDCGIFESIELFVRARSK
jgi:hypothetical protein